MKKADSIIFTLIITFLFSLSIKAQTAFTASALKALGAPNNPKVQVTWNRYYDYKEITEILQKMVKAYPELAALESIGKSYQGRDLWCITITNTKSGKHDMKPAFYIDAAIHANEIQAVEVALYTAWFLLESYETNPFVREMLDTKTFYIVPFQSPDSRDMFMHSPLTLRGGMVPRDNDGDGLMNEDAQDDLNRDGEITQMRIKVKGGRWKADPVYKNVMVRCEADEEGEYEYLGSEGIDNDGDGLVNEDGPGSYDPNRNWGWQWAPNYIQGGADWYPFSLPEPRAISDFIKSHRNILAAQSFHNSGGMILRGPGSKDDRTYFQDDQLFDLVGKKGEEIIPGYKYLVTWKDLYTVYGGETEFNYSNMGIMTYVNELWTEYNMFRKTEKENMESKDGRNEENKFNKLLLFDEATVPWKEFNHPQYGKIEIGGLKKTYGRMPPSFLLEEECHRNMAFVLMQASFLPAITIESVTKKGLPDGLTEVTAVIKNSKPLPTRLAVDVQNKINRPDWITIKGAKVITGGLKRNLYDEDFTEQKFNPDKLIVDTISGNSAVYAVWIVDGNGPVTIGFDSVKGGVVTKNSE